MSSICWVQFIMKTTLFGSITMFYGTNNISWNILTFTPCVGIFVGTLSVPQNIVMDLNNVMISTIFNLVFEGHFTRETESP